MRTPNNKPQETGGDERRRDSLSARAVAGRERRGGPCCQGRGVEVALAAMGNTPGTRKGHATGQAKQESKSNFDVFQAIRDGDADGVKRWSGLRDAGVFDLSPADSVVLQCGETGGAITADVVLFQPVTDDKTGPQPTYRPPVNARENVETFPAREARFVRFTIEETSRSPACMDELEVFSGKTNVALARTGAALTSSGDFVHPKHPPAHLKDGQYGNSRSWSAKDAKDAWVQIELAGPTLIDRIVWSRDREGKFTDRLATRYRIEVGHEHGVKPGNIDRALQLTLEEMRDKTSDRVAQG